MPQLIDLVLPHNWTSAEMIAAIRDMFVREEGDELVLGSGVPADWIRPGARWGVQCMPTAMGPVTYTMTVESDRTTRVEYDGPKRYRVDLPPAFAGVRPSGTKMP